MKTMKSLALLAMVCICFQASAAMAVTFEWLGISGNNIAVGDDLFGYEVIDWKNAAGEGPNNEWTVEQSLWGSNGSIWLYTGDDSATTDLTEKSSTVFFSMTGDSNDGIANFYVDDLLITTKDMFNLTGQGLGLLAISGLSFDYHTLKVEQAGNSPYSHSNHVAIWGGGAFDSSENAPVPEPATLLLLGTGLLSLAGFSARQKRKHFSG